MSVTYHILCNRRADNVDRLGFGRKAHTFCKPFRSYFTSVINILDHVQTLPPEKLKFWCEEPGTGEMLDFVRNPVLIVNMSDGPSSPGELEKALMSGALRCVVLGTHSGREMQSSKG